PKPDIPAQYDTAGKKVAVYVCSQNNSELSPIFKRELTTLLNAELLSNNAAAETVDYSDISDMILTGTDVITPETIGQVTNADIVIHIDINYFSVQFQASDKMEPGQVLCLISVIDAQTGQRLWPSDQLNKAYLINGKIGHDPQIKLTTGRIMHDLAEQAAIELARLFYLHKAPAKQASEVKS
ncbi:MAG: hypothetical protein JXM68_08520, partial [Sedimentisphaerales bacterium]|nr:hypothetical protein [Sedimentisphaerales bacterium]